MATIDGLAALVSGLGDYFVSIGVTAKVGFGLKARASQLNQGPGGANRVILIPGKIDPSAGPPKVVDAGTFSQPRQTSQNPRPLAWWHKVVTCSIWAVDASTPAVLQDELAQYVAAVNLLEATYQGLHNAIYTDPSDRSKFNVGLADLQLDASLWVSPPSEQAFGRELVVYFTHNGPIFDRAIDITTPKPAISRDPAT
jgi:hypothetical protein